METQSSEDYLDSVLSHTLSSRLFRTNDPASRRLTNDDDIKERRKLPLLPVDSTIVGEMNLRLGYDVKS